MSMIGNGSQTMQDIQQEKKREEEIQQFVGMRLGKEIYGIPIEKTREVTRFLQIASIPGTDAYIMGNESPRRDPMRSRYTSTPKYGKYYTIGK